VDLFLALNKNSRMKSDNDLISASLMSQAAWWQEISRLRASIEQKALSSIATCSIARNDVEAGSRLSFGQFL
ncbi:hypothetical protein, partial [Dialister sp. UBA1703]|uniref:hypothetical protein n=1 Tax=Dialister sp. UBA1703 TaxID=1946415 RepID=UPI0025B9AF09